ncbi:MAG: hypothetical protein WCJ49_09785 [Deltaproteobacteria bacterium]
MFLIVSFAPAIVIFIITLVLAFVSKILQRKLIDQKKMKEHKLKMKENNGMAINGINAKI